MIIFCYFQSDPALLPREEMFSLFAEVISTSPDTIKGSRLQVDIKQLLDEFFVISGIIKVEVSVIRRAEGRG